MASNQQIISDLQLIMEANHELELLATFKGVPFICKARVQSIKGDEVQLKALNPTMVCLEHEKRIKVLGSDYFEPSTAEVASFDILSGDVVLENFSYLGTKLGERMILRVEPNEPIEVELNTEGKKSSGRLADISLNGMGLKVEHAAYNLALKPGTNVQVSMELPNGSFSLSGTVLSSARMEEYQRLSVRFSQDITHRTTIFRYLVDRRNEIENELQQEYKKSLHAHKRG